jgi:hypothetical protein
MFAARPEPIPPRSPVTERIHKLVERTFADLDSLSYLKPEEKGEFRYYERSFLESIDGIGAKILAGKLVPLDLRGFPQVAAFPNYTINAGLFIGSFDPFQMTHLEAALRFLAAPGTLADIVFVVPEGSFNQDKPQKSDYRFRYEILNLQLKGVFAPLIVPLDIGEGTGTIGIVERFIAMFPGSTMNLTHVLGSDTLPYAAKFLPVDLKAWNAAALKHGVTMKFGMFVLKRYTGPVPVSAIRAVRRRGVPIALDRKVIGTPSSTDFRERGAFTIIFPTLQALRRVEVLFRYGTSRSWSEGQDPEMTNWPGYEV